MVVRGGNALQSQGKQGRALGRDAVYRGKENRGKAAKQNPLVVL
jgi:hypothetical protein